LSAVPGRTVLPLSDTGSHAAAASGDTRAKTNAGVGPAFARDVLVANCASAFRICSELRL